MRVPVNADQVPDHVSPERETLPETRAEGARSAQMVARIERTARQPPLGVEADPAPGTSSAWMSPNLVC